MIQALRNKSQSVTSGLFLILLGVFLYINSPFLMPMLLAGIFAMGLNEFITQSTLKLKVPRALVILFVILIGLALIWAPLTLAFYRLVTIFKTHDNLSTNQIMLQLNALKASTLHLVQKFSTVTGADVTTPTQDVLETLVRKIGELIFSFSSYVIGSAPSILFNGLIFTFFFIAFALRTKEIKNFSLKYSFVNEPMTEKIIGILKESCSITLFSTFVIGLIQAGIIVLGSLIFGEGDFWLVMPITFVVAFIPVIGAGPVGFLLTLLAFIGNRMGPAVGMLIFSIIASTIDNVLKPLLIGGKDLKISPLLSFTCIVGSILTLGLSGLLVGPIVMNLFIRLAPVLIENFNEKNKI